NFDVAIAHNEMNALNIEPAPCPKLLVCHNRKDFLTSTMPDDGGETLRRYNRILARLHESFSFVFISESKRASYGMPGTVILPGIDVDEYGGYTGDEGEVLRVGNMMRERNLMFDVDFQEQVCRGLPCRVVGDNPSIPGAKSAASCAELVGVMRRLRCLLHVTREEWEDGYNLSMLEAMACGMPVVSLANRTSPLNDGVDGYVSYDAGVLRKHLRALLEDQALAREVGAHGRETVAAKFPIKTFTAHWREAIEAAIASGGAGRRRARTSRAKRWNILLHCMASPLTTGRYIEQAARKRHNVVTAGFRVPEPLLAKWGYAGTPPAYGAQQIDLPLECTFEMIRKQLPEGFRPDLYVWVDSGPKEVPAGIDVSGMAKACYLVDTHIAPDLRLAMARHFEYTFLAQKGQVALFERAGIPNVTWLPLACSPELHNVGRLERCYDVAFICNPSNDCNDRRRNLMTRLAERFSNSRIGQCWPDEMTRVYAQSKIVVNACVNRDVNMRLFEGLASGALLLTDEADGLEDLFTDGEHLVVYRDDEALFDLVERYLGDDVARERIAHDGQAHVLAHHTYDHRVNELLRVIEAGPRKARVALPAGKKDSGEPVLLSYVPPAARRVLVLDSGGADGLCRTLKEQGVEEVVAIVAADAATFRNVVDTVLEGRIEELDLPYEDGHFDCIAAEDVLDYAAVPETALTKLGRVLAAEGVLLTTAPNARYFEVLYKLLNTRQGFEAVSIMERDHARYCTVDQLERMAQGAGLEVAHVAALCRAPEGHLPVNDDGGLTLGRATVGPISHAEREDFRTYLYLVAFGKPGVDRLAAARAALERHDNKAAYAVAQAAYGVDETERYAIMASAVARLGGLAEAERLYKEALTFRPGDAAVEGKLGVLYVAMNRYD
ncbi:MAG TPA: methyltransferase domain-containing protein, partial [Candidatus Hydrogenedentes bacterium]|nr:methyltransferase domain-containing protein [Candidatus Hydrogenedentota bacterium]